MPSKMPNHPSGIVSLEIGAELKNAGLAWEPQVGDWYAHGEHIDLVSFQSTIAAEFIQITDTIDDSFPHTRLMTIGQLMKENGVWLPSLDQCLQEIERRGYDIELESKENSYSCCAWGKDDGYCMKAETRADAAGKVLLWILRQ